jgi:hypothetical protein
MMWFELKYVLGFRCIQVHCSTNSYFHSLIIRILYIHSIRKLSCMGTFISVMLIFTKTCDLQIAIVKVKVLCFSLAY